MTASDRLWSGGMAELLLAFWLEIAGRIPGKLIWVLNLEVWRQSPKGWYRLTLGWMRKGQVQRAIEFRVLRSLREKRWREECHSYSIARNEIFIPWFLLHTSISFLWFPSLQRGEGMLNVRGTGTHTSLGLLPPLTSGVRWFLEVRQFF